MTMQLIKHYELASAQSSIVFSDIPQTYTDLKIVLSAKNTIDDYFFMYLNGSTSNYSTRGLRGNGSTATSYTDAAPFIYCGISSKDGFGNTEIYIPNYTSSNYKSFSAEGVSETNATSALMGIVAGLWSNTAAVTSIVLDATSGDFVQYSSATLYGVLAGSDGTTTVS